MKTCLLVCGHLAALKTTLSSRLSKDLRIGCLNKDSIKETLVDVIGFSNREENLLLSVATFELMKTLMQQLLQTQSALILESNFKSHEIIALKTVAEKADIRLVFLFLTGEAPVLYQRYVDRQPFRHKAHTSTGLMTFDTFVKSMVPYDKELFGPLGFKVDTTVMNDDIYLDLLNRIQSIL